MHIVILLGTIAAFGWAIDEYKKTRQSSAPPAAPINNGPLESFDGNTSATDGYGFVFEPPAGDANVTVSTGTSGNQPPSETYGGNGGDTTSRIKAVF